MPTLTIRPPGTPLPAMTLRDWFAGQALTEVANLITDNMPDPNTIRGVAQLAYEIADAMVIARTRTTTLAKGD